MSTRLRAARLLLTALVVALPTGLLFCAPLRFVPQVVYQPDGSVLRCYASGDEYYNWLHDAHGFTIVQDPTTGYYVYAQKVDGTLVPSPRVAGRDDPEGGGLQPWLNIAAGQMQAIRSGRLAEAAGINVSAPNTGAINNIVIFIRFSDEPEYTDLLSLYSNMFNASTVGISSMYNYFQEASYGVLSVVSSFYPTPLGGKIKSYKDANPRGYYRPYNAATNPNGYKTEGESAQREGVLLQAAANFIAPQVPGPLNIDSDNDGYVDNVCFIVTGTPTAWATLLWPHMSWLYPPTSINGKWVRSYNLQIRSSLLVDGASVLSHEMTHSLGAPDLYHYVSSAVEPVGNWDLMASNSNPPQHMGAYMKHRYLRWVGAIPTLSVPGRYSLHPLTSAVGNCFQIPSPYSSTEFFVVEYRKKTTLFESKLPGEGLLLYRINGTRIGNADGPPDEVYIYRPDGSPQANGMLSRAAMSGGTGFTTVDDLSNPRSFLSTGTPGGLRITDVGAIGDSISFTLTWPVAAVVDSASATAFPSDSVIIEWAATAQCRCKGFEVQRAVADTEDAYNTLPESFVPGDGTLSESRAFAFVDRSNAGEQYYRLKITDTSDAVSYSRSVKLRSASGIKEPAPPEVFVLEQNYPNPFNTLTVIKYTIGGTRGQGLGVSGVSLVVFDLLGRQVAVLVNERKQPGRYEVAFDGSGLASGVYFYRMTAGDLAQTRTLVLIK